MIQQLHFWVYAQKKQNQALRYLYTHIHSSITHTGQNVEATQVPVDTWINKQNVTYSQRYIIQP